MLTGDDAHALSPKKKKRRKHQDTPSQAGVSTEAPAFPASNAQHRTAANSPAVNGLAHGATAHSPAVAQAAAISTPTADQVAAQQPAAVTQNGVADSQKGTVSLWCLLQQNVTVQQESVIHDISNGLSRQILVPHRTSVMEPKEMLCKTGHMHQ
jgi:hypothetical protein